MTTPLFDLMETKLESGTTLVEASAGTGKTYTITGLVLRLLLEGKVESIGEVLVVTFTIAATEELKGRIRQKLHDAVAAFGAETDAIEDGFLRGLRERHGDEGRAVLRRALQQFDELAVFTIHGFCRRVLEQAAFESGTPFQVEFIEDELPVLRRAAQDAYRRLLYPRDETVAALAAVLQLTPEALMKDYLEYRRHAGATIEPRPEPLDEVTEELQQALRNAAELWDRPACAQLFQGAFTGKASGTAARDLPAFLEAGDTLGRSQPAVGFRAAWELGRDVRSDHLIKRTRAQVCADPFVQACVELADVSRKVEHSLRCAFLQELEQLFSTEKRAANVLTFDDLLHRLHDALRDRGAGPRLASSIRSSYRAALIDEFQDTDLVQYDIFSTAFTGCPLFLIGDPKQAIYGFRGADVFAYLEAKRDATRHFTLAQNHRSHPQLVAAVNALFTAAHRPFVHPQIGYNDVVPARTATEREITGEELPALQWRMVMPRPGKTALKATWNKELVQRRVLADVTAECVRLLDNELTVGDRRLHAGDVAVLVRTNAQAVATQSALRAAGIPSVIGKAGDIFESSEMTELERILLAISQPGYAALVRAAWATSLWGRTADEIAALSADDRRWEQEYERLEGWRRQWLTRGFVAMVEDLLGELQVRQRLLSRVDGDRRLTNVLQVVELLHQAEVEARLTPDGMLEWLTHERSHKDDIDYERRELRLESDARAVQILTVHGSKGLEYEVVFCPFLWDGRQMQAPRFSFHRTPREIVYDGGSPDRAQHLARAEEERLGEDLRLCYVALTRARRRCYLYWAAAYSAPGSALAYLLHQPPIDEDDWVKKVADHAKKHVSDWPEELVRVVAAHRELMDVDEVPREPPIARLSPAPDTGETLTPRPPPEWSQAGWRIASFSSLTSASPERGAAGEHPDHWDPPLLDAEAESPGGMAGFSRGAREGTCLHEIIEHLDFGAVQAPATEQLIRSTLSRYRLDRPEHHRDLPDPVAAVHQMLRQLCAATVPDGGFRLADLKPEQCASEWQFFLAMGEIRPRQLAEPFRRRGRDRVAAYGDRLLTLSGRQVRGFLTGFADLVAEHQGRYWLFDWKSNHLGNSATDYDDAGLWRSMIAHDYVLQYHLYALALHRHLRQRLPDYDYEAHFGGVCYAYLRGVEADTSHGLYVDRPPIQLIDALDRFAEGSR